MNCKYCGHDCVYVGTDDGGGPYGSSVCDEYWCEVCDAAFEANCIEYDDDDQDYHADVDDVGDPWQDEIDGRADAASF